MTFVPFSTSPWARHLTTGKIAGIVVMLMRIRTIRTPRSRVRSRRSQTEEELRLAPAAPDHVAGLGGLPATTNPKNPSAGSDRSFDPPAASRTSFCEFQLDAIHHVCHASVAGQVRFCRTHFGNRIALTERLYQSIAEVSAGSHIWGHKSHPSFITISKLL